MPDSSPELAADAADRRAALEAATYLAGQRHTDWPMELADRHREAWLDYAEAAYQWLRDRPTLRAVYITLNPLNIRTEGTNVTTSLNLQDDQELTFSLSGADDKGVEVPAPSDTWTWTSDDTAQAIVVLTVSADTTTATVAAVAPGTATISVAGQNTGLQGAEAVVVTAGPAVTIDLVAGTPSTEPGV
jgi:hypothetical protein